MTTFIALPLPLDIRKYITTLQDRLHKTGADIKLIDEFHLHLSLRFLGKINDAQLPGIMNVVKQVAAHNAAFTLTPSSIGAFPSLISPQVIWLGINAGNDEAVKMAEEVNTGLSRIGFLGPDKPFVSHITLGRTRSTRNYEQLRNTLQDISRDLTTAPSAHIGRIALYKTTLTSLGPRYEFLSQENLTTT